MAQRQSDIADTEQERLNELRARQPLIVQLGDSFEKRSVNMRAIDLLRSWHGSGEGGISPSEFSAKITEFGLHVSEQAELDALFKFLDDDRDGQLGLSDLKTTLVKLKDAALAARDEMENLSAKVTMLRERAAQALSLLDAIKKAEEEEAELEKMKSKVLRARVEPWAAWRSLPARVRHPARCAPSGRCAPCPLSARRPSGVRCR